MVSQAIVTEFCRSGAIDGSIETVKNALRERRDALAAALERELPEARFVAARGRLLPLGRAARGRRRGRAFERPPRSAAWCS